MEQLKGIPMELTEILTALTPRYNHVPVDAPNFPGSLGAGYPTSPRLVLDGHRVCLQMLVPLYWTASIHSASATDGVRPFTSYS